MGVTDLGSMRAAVGQLSPNTVFCFNGDHFDCSDELLPCRQLFPNLIYERLKDTSLLKYAVFSPDRYPKTAWQAASYCTYALRLRMADCCRRLLLLREPLPG